ncbi:MAG: 2-C-methyl-D-erythritol 2,4-cyclodiphosphate synthase [Burkholderiaceae bacterium]
MSLRIGQGFDVHALVPGRPLILGGVDIAHSCGLLGHSDADALLHAITDAILGAAALGDIGGSFPDTDPAYHGADSLDLLKAACQKLADAGYQLVNIDSTVIAQAPKLAPYVGQMRSNIAIACGLAQGQVNIKAKTAERLGSLGRQEGISAQAVVLIEQTG